MVKNEFGCVDFISINFLFLQSYTDRGKTSEDLTRDPDSVVFCTGKEVFHYPFSIDEKSSAYHIDKRTYKGGALPSTIQICRKTGNF